MREDDERGKRDGLPGWDDGMAENEKSRASEGGG